ncbi:MAG: rhomboid family intramembrane serine protease [Planctomycetes bacterium]|nr:rhomboid family intramembrane serine protease [Planctomycetota bacterium]
MPAWEDVSPYTEQRTRAHRFTWTNLLIVLNLTGFIITAFLLKSNREALDWISFDKSTAIEKFHLWQFATYSFVQMFDAVYIPWLILGIYVLFTVGNELEAEIGAIRYLALYFGCAAYGAVVHALFQYFGPVIVPGYPFGPAATLCAPVLGVAQTAAMRWPRRPVLFLFFLPLRLRTVLIGLGVLWMGFALWLRQGVGPSIGAVAAAIAIAALEPRINRSFERAAQRRERDQFLEEVDVRRRTDFILEKISREGLSSLTRTERKTLKQASQILNRGKGRPHE